MDLPVTSLRAELIQALQQERPRILLRAPTGSGKSTAIPPMLADAGWTEKGTILIVQPRRMAARLLAPRVSELRKSLLGQEVGYTVRFDNKSGPETRILYVTDGILERILLDNPLLKGISAVLFDEFHERRLAGDLCLARVMGIQDKNRSDLAVIVMSATLEINGLEDYLSPCTTLEAHGKMFPVEITYSPSGTQRDARGIMSPVPLWESASQAVRQAIRYPGHGNLLVFMPGAFEIRKTIEVLERDASLKNFDIFPLYGSLNPEGQNEAVKTGRRPRIIVSTNVAETSLTIEGLGTVIDTGVARIAARDTRRDINTLTIRKISQSSADQRAGRAGRTGPGRCIRLWSEADHARRPQFEEPEILRIDISGAFLALHAWGIAIPEKFHWLTPPSRQAAAQAESLLHDLKAITKEGSLSPIGKAMTGYPLPPRLSRLLVAGQEYGCLPEAAFIAALIQGENVFLKAGEIPSQFREKTDYSDFQAESRAVFHAEKTHFEPTACQKAGILGRSAREVLKSYDQLLRLASTGKTLPFSPAPEFENHREPVTRCLVETYSDHVGVRNGIAANTCRLVGGRRGRLSSGTAALHDMVFVAAEISEIEGKTLETKVTRCTIVDSSLLKVLFPCDWNETDEAIYDESRRRVIGSHRQMFRDLVITEKEQGAPSPEKAALILSAKIADETLTLVKWNEAVNQWIIRLHSLQRWMPELELPGFAEEDRAVAFNLLCEGATSYKEIKDREVFPIIHEWLSPWQRETLDKFAPTRIQLSNGQEPRVRYDEQGNPRIALTVQKLYGVHKTPCIAQGKIPVIIEVLAPNQRPWQVTSNLESFWQNGYPQMKKDLAARYPKHKWI